MKRCGFYVWRLLFIPFVLVVYAYAFVAALLRISAEAVQHACVAVIDKAERLDEALWKRVQLRDRRASIEAERER